MPVDLTDHYAMWSDNDKMGYILMILDCFSGYLRFVPESLKYILETPLFTGILSNSI